MTDRRIHPYAVRRLARALAVMSRARDRFGPASRGSTAIMFGLAATILFGFAGLAVDYTRGVRVQNLLQLSLDAAVLAAVQANEQSAAEVTFQNFVATKNSLFPGAIDAAVVSFDGETLVGRASVAMPTTIGAIVGPREMMVEVRSSARRAPRYQELYFAVDLSGSLGMGATEADRTALEKLTQPYVGAFYGNKLPQGCAFGCHRREGWEPDGKTVYQIAREAGIKLREDELIRQFDGLVDLLLDSTDEAVQKGMRKISVIAFSNWATQLIAPSDSRDSVKSVLANFPTGDRFETNYATAFDEFKNRLGTQGDGSKSNPNKMLILITDGIESRDAFFAQRSIDQSLCSSIKNSGFQLAIVELKYPKLVDNALYTDTVQPVETTISPGMEQCASPGWYFQAIDHDNVPVKFAELKDRIAHYVAHLVR